MSIAIGNAFCAPAPSAAPASPSTAKADEAAKRAEAQAKAEEKAAAEREAAKPKAKRKENDDVPKGFKPEAASEQLAALLTSTLAAV
jgi:sRNA-binding protein